MRVLSPYQNSELVQTAMHIGRWCAVQKQVIHITAELEALRAKSM